MLIPLSWLKDFVEIKLPVEKLAEKLSAAGLTVEKWTKGGEDYILDAEVTPNRPDWMSIAGVAREVAAITNSKFKIKNLKQNLNSKIKNNIKFNIDYDLCPRWTAVIIRDVVVKPSTELVKERLKKVGLRPINNLVDATNYVMWETGNPLHVFDLDKIRGQQMILTESKGGEDFRSLDGINYKLPPGAIIIKDLGRVVDLCGIKGGENSAVSADTKNILLVVPIYNGVAVRRASQALGLRSDASAIFERGADAGNTVLSLQKAAALIGGEPEGLIDLKEKEFEPWEVSVSHEKIERILGIQIDRHTVKKIFEGLGMTVRDEYTMTIPTFRNDIHIEEDLIEEVGRIIGYDNFPKTLPDASPPTEKVAYAKDYDFEYEVKNILKGAGYNEIYTYSLVSETQLQKLGLTGTKVLNPISKDYEYLRPTLFGNILEAYKLNLPNFQNIKLFELGKEYCDQEHYWLSTISSGDKFYEAKGGVETILNNLGINYVIKPAVFDWFHPGRSAEIFCNQKSLGLIGEINPTVLSKFSIKGRAVYWALDFELLEKLANKNKKYHPIPMYPPIIEDLTLTIPEGALVGEIINKIKATSKLIVNVELISIHEHNFSFRITYQNQTRNLTDKDIEPLRKKNKDCVIIGTSSALRRCYDVKTK
jgi:phenylalanyl-tRNA synthetase beta chain